MVKVVGTLLLAGLMVGVVREHPWLLTIAGAIALLVMMTKRARPASTEIGHSHGGTSAFIARHEAGHAAVARRVGMRGVTVRAWQGGGATYARRGSTDPVDQIAVARAGQYAVGSRRGCGGDDAIVRGILRQVPRQHRARVQREGEALGRRAVRQSGGAIRRDARTIQQTGRL